MVCVAVICLVCRHHHPFERKSHILGSLHNSVFNFVLLTTNNFVSHRAQYDDPTRICSGDITGNRTLYGIRYTNVLICSEKNVIVQLRPYSCVAEISKDLRCDMRLLVIVTTFRKIIVRNFSKCSSRLEFPMNQKTLKITLCVQV